MILTESNLNPYRVMLHEAPGDQLQLIFECMAEDEAHAREQAKNAYPGCVIVECQPESALSLHVIHSQSESALNEGAGFWNNADGWTTLSKASKFSQAELRTLNLPNATGLDARWVPLNDARRMRTLEVLRAGGLTIGECINALAVPNDDPYVEAARAAIQTDDDVEIDDQTTTSVGNDGAWVLTWMWISDKQAGVLSHSEMLEEVWNRASDALTGPHGLDTETARLRRNQADWLEDLLSNYVDEVDDIESARPVSEPGSIVWVDEDSREVRFMPSEALLHLLALARQAGLKARNGEHCEQFCAQHGRTLDAILTVVQLA